MVLSNEKRKEYVKRLLLSRMRLLCNNGFYGLLLMHMKFALDEECPTAATDGRKIYFGPKFLDSISDRELDFIMMHEIMHVVLKHVIRTGKRDPFRFNVACDIVVNSNILKSMGGDKSFITLKNYGESMHVAPDGKEGFCYTAEEVYDMLPKFPNKKGKNSKGAPGEDKQGDGWGQGNYGKGIDDHRKWKDAEEASAEDAEEIKELEEEWTKRLEDVAKTIEIRDRINGRDSIPLCAKRVLKKLKQPQTDWRTILNNFVQEEVVDYSFTPPDRRFDDNPFYLPDFNEKDIMIKRILFMIDASASVDDKMLTQAYSEVKGAIEQFGGRLEGWLGFFDADVVKPKKFTNVEEFKVISPKGGGGTNFLPIFKYVEENMLDDPPASIIILTDGYAPYPSEDVTMGIPTLWVICDSDITPPWGKVCRIKSH